MSQFSALRSRLLERGIRLPAPYPYTRRTLAGSALAALAVGLILGLLILTWNIASLTLWATGQAMSFTIRTSNAASAAFFTAAEQAGLKLFPEMQAKNADTQSILPPHSHLGNSMKADIVQKTLPYGEGTPATLTDAARQIDFSLLQTVLRLQLNKGQVLLLTSDYMTRGQDAYNLQRMRIYLPPLPSSSSGEKSIPPTPEEELKGPPEPIFRFVNALAESLDVWAERAILSEAPYKLTLGTKRTLTHEIWLEPANPVFSFPESSDPSPRMTIILSGMGQDLKAAQALLDLRLPLTFSILPFGKQAEQTARAARLGGQEIILELPMESMQSPFVKAGPNELGASMDMPTMEAILKKATDKFPYATGATNTMGSRLTSDQAASRRLCEVFAKSGLYVFDAMTSTNSVLYAEARRRGLPAWHRTITLDNDAFRSEKALLEQLKKAEAQARAKGHVVVMASPHPRTIAVLKKWSAERDQAVRMVPLRLQPITGETLTPEEISPLPAQTEHLSDQ